MVKRNGTANTCYSKSYTIELPSFSMSPCKFGYNSRRQCRQKSLALKASSSVGYQWLPNHPETPLLVAFSTCPVPISLYYLHLNLCVIWRRLISCCDTIFFNQFWNLLMYCLYGRHPGQNLC